MKSVDLMSLIRAVVLGSFRSLFALILPGTGHMLKGQLIRTAIIMVVTVYIYGLYSDRAYVIGGFIIVQALDAFR